jgi:hypothetical protein
MSLLLPKGLGYCGALLLAVVLLLLLYASLTSCSGRRMTLVNEASGTNCTV